MSQSEGLQPTRGAGQHPHSASAISPQRSARRQPGCTPNTEPPPGVISAADHSRQPEGVGSRELQPPHVRAPEEPHALDADDDDLLDMVRQADAPDLLMFFHQDPELFLPLVLDYIGRCPDGELPLIRRWLQDWRLELQRQWHEPSAAEWRRWYEAATAEERRRRYEAQQAQQALQAQRAREATELRQWYETSAAAAEWRRRYEAVAAEQARQSMQRRRQREPQEAREQRLQREAQELDRQAQRYGNWTMAWRWRVEEQAQAQAEADRRECEDVVNQLVRADCDDELLSALLADMARTCHLSARCARPAHLADALCGALETEEVDDGASERLMAALRQLVEWQRPLLGAPAAARSGAHRGGGARRAGGGVRRAGRRVRGARGQAAYRHPPPPSPPGRAARRGGRGGAAEG